MTKSKFEREQPDNILKRTLNAACQKIKQTLSAEEFKLNEFVEKKIDSVISDLEAENVKISRNELLKLALEELNVEQGGLPENLNNRYIDLIAEEIANVVASGHELYKAIGEKMVQLKRKGIDIDGKAVGEKVKMISQ